MTDYTDSKHSSSWSSLALGEAGVTGLLLSCMAWPGQGGSMLAWR